MSGDVGARVRSRSGSRGPGRGVVSAGSGPWAAPTRTVRACAGDARPSVPVTRAAGRPPVADTERRDGAPVGAGWGTPGPAAADRPATAYAPGRAPVTRRRACLGTPATRTRVRRAPHGRTRAERALVGVAVALCSATAVVLLGLTADLSADAHTAPPSGSSSVSGPVSP